MALCRRASWFMAYGIFEAIMCPFCCFTFDLFQFDVSFAPSVTDKISELYKFTYEYSIYSHAEKFADTTKFFNYCIIHNLRGRVACTSAFMVSPSLSSWV